MKRIAIIINGDTEDRHLANVKRALAVQKQEGFEVYVASPQNPGIPADHFVESTTQNVRDLLTSLKGKIRATDELEVYTTGHGETGKKISTLCLKDDCSDETIALLIDALPYAQRTIVTDQCYGGNWARMFVDDPKTLFVAAGSKGEAVCCEEVAPRFYAPVSEVTDLNGDGQISRQERYAYAVGGGVPSSSPMFIPTEGYVASGRPPFENSVIEFQKTEELTVQLKRLKPGHYAIVTFGAGWCPPCETFKPEFEAMAARAGGQHLFLRTLNEDVAKEHGVTSYPTVMILSHDGKCTIVEDRNRVLSQILQIGLSQGPADVLMRQLDQVVEIVDEEKKSLALESIAEAWRERELGAQKKVVLDRLIAVAHSLQSKRERESAFDAIAGNIYYHQDTQWLGLGVGLLNEISNAPLKMATLRSYAEWMRDQRMPKQAAGLLKQAVAASERSQDYNQLSELASICGKFGDVDNALLLLNRALDVIDVDEKAYAKSLRLSVLLEDFPRKARLQAGPFLKRLEAAANALPNMSGRLMVLTEVVEFLWRSGQKPAARVKYQQVLEMVRQLPSEKGERSDELTQLAVSMWQLSRSHDPHGLLAEAEASLPMDPDLRGKGFYSIAENMRGMGFKAEARDALVKLADVAEKMKVRDGYKDAAWYLMMSGLDLSNLGYKADARKVLRRAIVPTVQITEKTRSRWMGYLVVYLQAAGLPEEAKHMGIFINQVR